MNHLERQNVMAEYVKWSVSQEKKPTTVLILHVQTFLQTSENCRCSMTVEKRDLLTLSSKWTLKPKWRKGRAH